LACDHFISLEQSTMLKRTIAIAALCVLGAGIAIAQDPVTARQNLMKGVGQATGPMGRMLRGELPFDLAAVQNSLRVYQAAGKNAPALFPAGSEGGETKALPLIWQEKDKFNATFAKLDADATAALAAITSEATFKTEMPKVLGNCGACHTPYRKPQQ
jgi:cytochrome c556